MLAKILLFILLLSVGFIASLRADKTVYIATEKPQIPILEKKEFDKLFKFLKDDLTEYDFKLLWVICKVFGITEYDKVSQLGYVIKIERAKFKEGDFIDFLFNNTLSGGEYQAFKYYKPVIKEMMNEKTN